MEKSKRMEKIITQANPLIEAKKHMNLTGLRIFCLGLSNIVPHIKDNHIHDLEFKDTWISHSELQNLYTQCNNGNIENLKKYIMKEAKKNFIVIHTENGGFLLRNIYDEMEYTPEKGLRIKFNEKMKPYILELARQPYTMYKLKIVFLLSSKYSVRLLELLLKNQGFLKKGKDKIFLNLTIEDLKEKLDVPSGKYQGRINNFKEHVLDLPIKEINFKTEYHMWYETQKIGRKVTGFKFWLKLKDNSSSIAKTSVQQLQSSTEPIESFSTPIQISADKRNMAEFEPKQKESSKKAKSDSQLKSVYGEYKNVYLSDEEIEKLREEYPQFWEEYIELVSEYCAMHGKQYDSYFAVIRHWIRINLEKEE